MGKLVRCAVHLPSNLEMFETNEKCDIIMLSGLWRFFEQQVLGQKSCRL